MMPVTSGAEPFSAAATSSLAIAFVKAVMLPLVTARSWDAVFLRMETSFNSSVNQPNQIYRVLLEEYHLTK